MGYDSAGEYSVFQRSSVPNKAHNTAITLQVLCSSFTSDIHRTNAIFLDSSRSLSSIGKFKYLIDFRCKGRATSQHQQKKILQPKDSALQSNLGLLASRRFSCT